MQTKSIIQFNGTEEQLYAGCVGNGYTGFVGNVNTGFIGNNPMLEPAPQTMNEFLSLRLRDISPYQFIVNATIYWERKLGTEAYNRAEMEQAMKDALTITVITE